MAVTESGSSAEQVITNDHLQIPVDAEHNGIRIAGCTTLFATMIVAFLIFNTLIPDFAVFSALLAVIIAAGAMYLLDRFLKGRWPSGRVLKAQDNTIQLTKHDQTEREIDPTQHVNVLTWRFLIKRTVGRAKKGWFVIAIALEQDGEYIPVYTFAPPDEARQMPLFNRFTELKKSKAVKADTVQDLRMAGEQRRLMEAERDRGFIGAEMTFEQFTAYIEFLQDNYPKWMLKQA